MQRFLVTTAAVTVTVIAVAVGASHRGDGIAASDLRARGEYLVKIGGCNDCHTPVQMDPHLGLPVPMADRLLSGHPEGAPDPETQLSGQDAVVAGPTFTSFRMPFGIVRAANLTPDLETGIGGWTADTFILAMRSGGHMGGRARPILPPMPWANVASLSDADLRAMFAYLHSIPPVKNAVPDPRVPEPALSAIRAGYDALLVSSGNHDTSPAKAW